MTLVLASQDLMRCNPLLVHVQNYCDLQNIALHETGSVAWLSQNNDGIMVKRDCLLINLKAREHIHTHSEEQSVCL